MDIYKLYALATSDTDAAASIDIQLDGFIVAYAVEVNAVGADALNDGGQVEVSFASTNGLSSNDTKSSFAHAYAQQGFLTTGGSMVRANSTLSGLAIAVAAGERIYMHIELTGTVTVQGLVYLYVMPLADASARAAARRR